MTKIQAIRKFADFLAEGHTTIARIRCFNGNWSMDIDDPNPRLSIPRDFNYRDEMDEEFYQDFVNRYPPAKEFSDVTLTILHEFGHWYNRNVMDIAVYTAMTNSNEDYFNNPYEVLATQWAICWLLCPANCEIAKEFERDFFNR